MAEALMLEVVTPEREVDRESVAEVQLPGLSGYLGILPGHTPLLTQLGIGSLIYKKGAESGFIAVIGGFAEVLPERVTVLAEAAERSEEIDVARALADLAEAEKRLAASSTDPNTDWDAMLKSVASARARLEAASHGAPSANKET
ncbi:MAG: F0F1 ATP synthase subunit epsilon [Acidobacteria bacterium]|nr:MAG: F0F1 ATP synthase subunit epsilon [Acidobacteriota bacterium]